MRSAVVVIIAIGLMQQQAPDGKQIPKSDNSSVSQKASNQSPSTEKSPAGGPPLTDKSADHRPPSSGVNAAANPRDEDREVQRKLKDFTAWLVVVGVIQGVALILQAVILVYTLKQVRRQADTLDEHKIKFEELAKAANDNAAAARDNASAADRNARFSRETAVATADVAKAAILNAQAAINSERAWVIPELRPLVRHDENARHWVRRNGSWLSTEDILRGEHMHHCLSLNNIGKTPAQIVGFQIKFSYLQGIVSDLPPETQARLVKEEPFNHFLASGDGIEIFDPPIDVNALILEKFDSIEKCETTAVFHGWVQYRHMFSSTEDWYAEFCYVFTPKLKRLTSAGPYPKQRSTGADVVASGEKPR